MGEKSLGVLVLLVEPVLLQLSPNVSYRRESAVGTKVATNPEVGERPPWFPNQKRVRGHRRWKRALAWESVLRHAAADADSDSMMPGMDGLDPPRNVHATIALLTPFLAW